jgi:3D-(3,5/4)-trihydroxycyclohexane-1,2-dione acylhydrolase (decyclizing)
MKSVRLTMAQALVRHLVAQRTRVAGEALPLVTGVWAIFGHGNVAGLGEALYANRQALPTYRAHNEQAMAHAAIAYAKARKRRQFMACTSSIGPGATNMVTAAALAHVNRLPVLLLPGDTFASRIPDPVLQQVEDFEDPAITANDCFRPVSRYFDRITAPARLIDSLPEAIRVMTDPATCGPATLALPQDAQTWAYDYPLEFFDERVHEPVRAAPVEAELVAASAALRASSRPLIVAGGGVQYSGACPRLGDFAEKFGIPVTETQAGKGSIAWDHPLAAGAIGVTGSAAANTLAREADLVLAVGTRLQDFTTASRTLFERPETTLVGLNACGFDARKHGGLPLVCDARLGLEALDSQLGDWRARDAWTARVTGLASAWNAVVDEVTRPDSHRPPSDAEVVGAVNRAAGEDGVVVCAAGGLPGELHKLWRSRGNDDYHLEYGYSCMGYEIAGGLGVKMADPRREVFVMVGDGSYLMLNSEIATSVMLGLKLIIVVLDNRGFGCINRLQQACGGAPFNNLLRDAGRTAGAPDIDYAAHAGALGARAEQVRGIDALEAALGRARAAEGTYVVAIETDPDLATQPGGAWWDVAVPEVSERQEVQRAYAEYAAYRKGLEQ